MAQARILAFVGGISKGSLNQKLFRAFRERAPQDIQLDSFDISALPFYSQDLEPSMPAKVTEMKAEIEKSQGILFITPEYNRSYPGVLKNALDWGSRPGGKNSWGRKPAGVVGASSGNIGTFGAQNHLRQVLVYLNMMTMSQPEFYFNGSKSFDENGQLTDEKTKQFIDQYWMSFHAWLRKVETEAVK